MPPASSSIELGVQPCQYGLPRGVDRAGDQRDQIEIADAGHVVPGGGGPADRKIGDPAECLQRVSKLGDARRREWRVDQGASASSRARPSSTRTAESGPCTGTTRPTSPQLSERVVIRCDLGSDLHRTFQQRHARQPVRLDPRPRPRHLEVRRQVDQRPPTLELHHELRLPEDQPRERLLDHRPRQDRPLRGSRRRRTQVTRLSRPHPCFVVPPDHPLDGHDSTEHPSERSCRSRQPVDRAPG